MSAQTQFYLVAVPAVIILGLSEGGFSSLSSLAMLTPSGRSPEQPLMGQITCPPRTPIRTERQ
jgi:hypothetical protein